MTMKFSRRPALVTAAALSAALVFTGCSAADDEPIIDDEQSTQVEPEAPETEPETEEPDEDPAPAGEQTEVQIGESISDPDMDDTVEIVSAVRDFASEEEAELIAGGGEVVLLQVTVTPGQEYGGQVSMGNFKISWDEGDDFWGNKTRMVAEEMEAAGFEVLDNVARRDGGEHTGWMAFLVDEKSDSYLLQYERAGASVIGSDETIDPFSTEVTIPAS